jgi:predicted hotdog family 3-hydroxylacyl-ACP dehydratase
LLPHTGSAILIDRIVTCHPDRILCAVRLPFQSASDDAVGSSALLAIELFAQAAALLGSLGHPADLATGPGGRRGYVVSVPELTLEAERLPQDGDLLVEVRQSGSSAGAGRFEGRVEIEGKLLAQGVILVAHGRAVGPTRTPNGVWVDAER